MFKKIFLSLFFFWLFFSFSKADIQWVYFRFCDMQNEKDQSKTITIQPWQETEVCLNFFTTDQDPIVVKYWFSEWLLNQSEIQVCDQDMSDNNDFSKLFTSTEWKREFTLSSWKIETVKEKIRVPLWMNGMTYWCVAYTVQADNKRAWWIFDIVVRKTANLNLFIWWDADIKSSVTLLPNNWKIFSSNDKIKAEIVDNELLLSFLVSNQGNISQNIVISWKIYNPLWFQQRFEITSQKLIPGSSWEFVANIWAIPFYKWPFNVKFNLLSTPSFDFDSSKIDEKLKEPISISQTWQIFIFTRIWLIILAFIILILVLIFRPMFKKHYITPTPTIINQPPL
jgi:hypothetical protein